MIRVVPAALAALLSSGAVLAQQYPAKPVRVVLTISGGGETNAHVVGEAGVTKEHTKEHA